MTRQEIARKGGQALVAKYGTEYMAKIGSKGFWATINALAERQEIPLDYKGNPFRNLLKNLQSRKR